jgi:hypothetical protein
MLPTRKWLRGLYSLFILTLLSAIALPVAGAEDDVPAGFKADRYQKVWERNPFTLVTPAVMQVRTTPFDKLILVSWLIDGGRDVVFVQNTETSEVQKVTNDPNPNNLRLVAIHKDTDPKKADVVLSNGAEQGSVKFRLEVPMAAPQVSGGQQPPGPQNKVPGAAPGVPIPPGPGVSRQMQFQQNAQQQALQQAARVGAAQTQQGAAPTQPENGVMPPRASEVRRKRITPPPPNEQPVGAPTPYQAPSNQSAPQ